jgi:hypothetical protein
MPKSKANQDPLIDSRRVRANALITTAIFASTLLVPSAFKIILVSIQVIAFSLGVFIPKYHPYGWVSGHTRLFKLFPRGHGEHPKAIRFSQKVGLIFAVPALVLLISGNSALALIPIGLCLIAAGLNAFMDICLACLIYPRFTLVRHRVRNFGSH